MPVVSTCSPQGYNPRLKMDREAPQQEVERKEDICLAFEADFRLGDHPKAAIYDHFKTGH